MKSMKYISSAQFSKRLNNQQEFRDELNDSLSIQWLLGENFNYVEWMFCQTHTIRVTLCYNAVESLLLF